MSRGRKMFSAGVGLFGLAAALVGANSAIAQTVSDPVAGVDNIAPDAPENLMAEVDIAGPSVELTWEPSPSEGVRSVPVGPDFTSAGPSFPVNDVVRYNIRRSELGGEAELIVEVPVAVGYDSYTYVDETVESGISYDYSVTAVDGGDNESEAVDSGPVEVGRPVASISPEGDIAFGEVGPDSVTSETVTVSNIGSADLRVQVSVEGDGFSIDLDVEESVVPVDDEISFAVSFVAAEVADYSGTLTITTNDLDNPETVIALSATVLTPPVVSISPEGEIAFGEVGPDSEGSETVTVTNAATDPDAVLGVEVSIEGDGFAIDLAEGNEPIILAINEEISFSVSFLAAEVGNSNLDYSGTLTITTNDPDNRETVIALSATIVGGMDPPEIVLNRSRFNFRNVLVGTRGTKNLIVTNKGAADLEVSSFAIAGDDAFSIDDEVPVPSGTDTVAIHFEPASTGDFRADITITSNDPRNPEVEVTVLGSSVTELVCARVEVIVDPGTGKEVQVVGFVDDDNDVDYDDFFLFDDFYGFTEDDIEFDYKADFDCDGVIDLDDFMKFADTFIYGREVKVSK